MADAVIGNLVAQNYLHDIFLSELSDGGCIYNLGVSIGTVIDNNLCHNSDSYNYGGWLLYLDEGSSNVSVTNNIAFSSKDASFHQHYGFQNVISNNIFAFPSSLYCNETTPGSICDNSAIRSSQHPVSSHDAGVNSSFSFIGNIVLHGAPNIAAAPWVVNNTQIVHTYGPTLGVANFTYERNLYWSNALASPTTELVFGASGDPQSFAQWQAVGKDVAGVIADPLFANASAFNFTLLPGSPALALGFQQIDMSNVGPRSGPYRHL